MVGSGEEAPADFLLARDRMGREVYLSPIPAMVFWQEGISEVSIVEDFFPPDHYSYSVFVQLEPSLAERFEAVTKSLVNGWLALCRGQDVIVVARVYKEIEGGRFFLAEDGSLEGAQALGKELGFEPRAIHYPAEAVAYMRRLHSERRRLFEKAKASALDESPLWTVLRETPLQAKPREGSPVLTLIRPPWVYPQSMEEIQAPPGMAFLHRPGWIALDTGTHSGWVRREDVVPELVAAPEDTLRRNLLGSLIGERCPKESSLTPDEQRIDALYRVSIEGELRRRLKDEEEYKAWYQENVQRFIEGQSCQQLTGTGLYPGAP